MNLPPSCEPKKTHVPFGRQPGQSLARAWDIWVNLPSCLKWEGGAGGNVGGAQVYRAHSTQAGA